MKCPKCQYVRTVSDLSPNYECPQCGIVYAKFDPAVEEKGAALRLKMAGRKQPRFVADVQTLNPNPDSYIKFFLNFVRAPKGRFSIFALWACSVVLVWVLLRFMGEVGLGILFLTPLMFILLRKTDGSKVKSCPSCSGWVAYGIRVCPYCGKSKPAPRPVGKGTFVIAWLFMGMMIVVSVKNPGSSYNPSPPNSADDPSVRLGAQATVQAAGYRCDTVTNMRKLILARGFSINCDNYRDSYSITDEGGRVHVRLD